MKLAIVGSTLFEKDADAKAWAGDLIYTVLDADPPALVISGGAIGIDSLAVEIASQLGIPYEEYEPKIKRWRRGLPDGFEARNIKIAEACTHLLAIRHHASKTYGSGWTADRAAKLGKPVQREKYQDPADSLWVYP